MIATPVISEFAPCLFREALSVTDLTSDDTASCARGSTDPNANVAQATGPVMVDGIGRTVRTFSPTTLTTNDNVSLPVSNHGRVSIATPGTHRRRRSQHVGRIERNRSITVVGCDVAGCVPPPSALRSLTTEGRMLPGTRRCSAARRADGASMCFLGPTGLPVAAVLAGSAALIELSIVRRFTPARPQPVALRSARSPSPSGRW
jgi:hypothetical protein